MRRLFTAKVLPALIVATAIIFAVYIHGTLHRFSVTAAGDGLFVYRIDHKTGEVWLVAAGNTVRVFPR